MLVFAKNDKNNKIIINVKTRNINYFFRQIF